MQSDGLRSRQLRWFRTGLGLSCRAPNTSLHKNEKIKRIIWFLIWRQELLLTLHRFSSSFILRGVAFHTISIKGPGPRLQNDDANEIRSPH